MKSDLDSSVRPQDDFFTYAVGGWLKKNPIPPTKSRWGTFDKLRENVDYQLHAMVKDLVKKKRVVRGSPEQQLRDLFLSGMNIRKRNALGITPIKQLLEEVESLASQSQVYALVTRLHRLGFSPLFGIFVGQDDKQSDQYVTYLHQHGLTMPEKEFYLDKTERAKKVRAAFLVYAARLFELAGTPASRAHTSAAQLLALETKLARISMNQTDRRDIEKIYNKKTLAELQRLAPTLSWKQLFQDVGLPTVKSVVVYQPDYLKGMSAYLQTIPLNTWKLYLTWTILDDASPYLTEEFEQARFDFYGKALTGRKKMEPRWKRTVSVVERHIGELLGKEYVWRHFPPQAKKRMDRLVDDLFGAYAKRIRALDWMSPKTKKKALQKLATMNRKIGYPLRWKSYRGLAISPDDYFGNVLRITQYDQRRYFRRLGKKVDRAEWFMTPQTVNAYYSPNLNDIVFPAAILQPPFFSLTAHDALNYGGIGSVIGHEMTHGFDDQGSKFDSLGNFNNWWTAADRKKFEQKSKLLVTQFNAYRVGDLFVKGKLTLGENIADLGGLFIAHDAYVTRLKKEGRESELPKGERNFFLGFALAECGHERPESARTRIFTDPHSPSKFRVNGPVSNFTPFYEAFGVTAKHKLYRKPTHRAEIW